VATRLGDLLDDARRRTFVGRRRELVSFDDALMGSSPEGFENAVAAALGQPAGTGPGRSALPVGAVLLVDGYEQLGPVDGWLRQGFLPALPAECVVVLAGRAAPAAPWRSDPGWRWVVAVHRLDHFDEAEAGQLLARAGVAPPDRPQLVRLGRGHPLAMALLAEIAVTGTLPDSLAEVPDLVSVLLESLLRGAPTEAHMTGLAACTKAWLTTEVLRRKVVGADAGAVWAWLERRTFVTCGQHGLVPHDLARGRHPGHPGRLRRPPEQAGSRQHPGPPDVTSARTSTRSSTCPPRRPRSPSPPWPSRNASST
jgi:hypothetical protein